MFPTSEEATKQQRSKNKYFTHDAFLQPPAGILLEYVYIHDMYTRCYAVGTDMKEKHYYILCFTKSRREEGNENNRPPLQYHIDPKVYTYDEYQKFINKEEMADFYSYTSNNNNNESIKIKTKVIKGKALLGCIRFTRNYYYLVLVTKHDCIAHIGFHRIFKVVDIELVPLRTHEHTSSTSLSLTSPLLVLLPPHMKGGDETQTKTLFSSASSSFSSLLRAQARDEEYYRGQFTSHLGRQHVYYSRTYDLTNTLQRNIIPAGGSSDGGGGGGRGVREKFVWNEFLMKPFFSSFTEDDKEKEKGGKREEENNSTQAAPPDISPWAVHIVHGCIIQRPLRCGGRKLLLLLIARVSKHFAGVRYRCRGVDGSGHAANHVELEQIVINESALRRHFTQCDVSSHVQVRGSVPLRWHHPPTHTPLPRPPIKYGGRDVYYKCTRKHFQELLEDYGRPVIVMNLLRQGAKHQREFGLSQEYKKAVMTLKGFMNNKINVNADNKEEEEEDEISDEEEVLFYEEFDIREFAHGAWNNITAFAEDAIEKTGFFVCRDININNNNRNSRNSSSMSIRCQEGIVRSNCLDCVDRTNLAQFFIGLHVLGHQLKELSLLHSHADISRSPQVQQLFLHMYLFVGDAVAVQYGGSPQVGVGVLHRGKGWDKLMSIRRLYNNMIIDHEKQMSLNLFLGNHELYSSSTYGKSNNNNNNKEEEEKEKNVIKWWRKPLRKYKKNFSLHDETNNNNNNNNNSNSNSMREVCISERNALIIQDEDYYYNHRRRDSNSNNNNSNNNNSSNSSNNINQSYTEVLQRGEVTTLQPTTEWSNSLAKYTALSSVKGKNIISEEKKMFMKYLLPHCSQSDTLCKREKHEINCGGHFFDEFRRDLQSSYVYKQNKFLSKIAENSEVLRDFLCVNVEILSAFDAFVREDFLFVNFEGFLLQKLKRNKKIIKYLNYFLQQKYHNEETEREEKDERKRTNENLLIFEEKIKSFIESIFQILLNYFLTLNAEISKWLMYTRETWEEEEESFVCRVSFPESTCRFIQKYFQEILYPSKIYDKLQHFLSHLLSCHNNNNNNNESDSNNHLRYVNNNNNNNNNNSFVPPTVILRNCFNNKKLYNLLLNNSHSLGLTLHRHYKENRRTKEENYNNEDCWKFILWLIYSSIIIPLRSDVNFGIVITKKMSLNELRSHNNLLLFTFHESQEIYILNDDNNNNNILKDYINISSSSSSSFHTTESCSSSSLLLYPDAVMYAESLVKTALYILSSIKEITSFCNKEDNNNNNNNESGEATKSLPWLLNKLFLLSTSLRGVNINILKPKEKWSFWVNVYNALYIHAWLITCIIRGQSYVQFYICNGYEIGGYFFSLHDIKNGILRGNKPAFFSLFPPFEKNDIRALYIPKECSHYNYEQVKKNEEGDNILLKYNFPKRMLLTLIDTFILPDNIENVFMYNPRLFLQEEEYRHYRDVFINMEEKENNNNNNNNNKQEEEEGEGEEEEEEEKEGERDSRYKGNKRSSIETINWFMSLFKNRLKNKNIILSHPCTVLKPSLLEKQVYEIEEKVLEFYSSAAASSSSCGEKVWWGDMRMEVPRVMLPLFLYPQEFGTTTEEILQTLHEIHNSAI